MSGHSQKSKLTVAVFLAVVAVTMSGYFFAKQKSKPVFRTKIERIMFEKKNKSPKYILTLPEKTQKARPTSDSTPNIVARPSKLETLEDFVNAAPLVAKLKEHKDRYNLRYVDNQASLSEQKDGFLLPKISDQGKKPWMEYGHQVFVSPNFYKVAVVFKNTGIDVRTFESMNKVLPSEVSFSFSPYTIKTKELITEARKLGHETYMDLLLASRDVLKADNGPLAMGLTVGEEENMRRFYTAMSTNAPIGGMTIVDGMIDDTTKSLLYSALQELKGRGLLVVDATNGNEVEEIQPQKLARKKADIVISDNFTNENMQYLLRKAEQIARDKGQVLIVATPKPIVITAIKNWAESFSPQLSYEQMKEQNITSIERPFALVPVSNLVVE